MNSLYIVGAGSVGGHIAANIDLYGLSYNNIYFLDDNHQKIGTDFLGIKVVGSISYLFDISEKVDIIIGIAFPEVKKSLVTKLADKDNLRYPILKAHNSWVSSGVNLDQGTIIYPNCSINYGCNIGKFVVLNMNCAIGHHSSIGDFTSLAPGVNFGGHTTIGNAVDVGIGVSTIQGVSIGDNTIVGGQSMVTKSFPSFSKLVGVPAQLV